MSARPLALIPILLLTALLGGCADLLPNRRPPPPTPHDLGWLPPPRPMVLGEIPVLAVEAPPWLNDPAVRYRRSGAGTTALQAYADDYWVASPRELVLDRMQQALLTSSPTGPAAGNPRYRLEVRLLRFEQEQGVAKSEAVVALQAVLKEPRSRRQFIAPAIEARVATGAGPEAAVRGLGEATDAAIRQLLTWIAQTQHGNPPATETGADLPATGPRLLPGFGAQP